MDEDVLRSILVRRKARLFSREVKGVHGMALRLPEELVDWLLDEDIPVFREHLEFFGLVQRLDGLWEPRSRGE